ncbi:MAG: hypothetical protein LBL76_11470 [Treponema sp.]|jgi:hypothetical protein|nr:hypothetical protein [Treponema sp.]
MRTFLCGFEGIFLGVPSECVAEIIQVSGDMHAMIEGKPHKGQVFFSLPRFFCRADLPTPHGIRLKPLAYPEALVKVLGTYTGTEAPGVVLVTPPVETEVDIPPEAIQQLPDFLRLPGSLPFLRGVSFTGATMTAFIDPVLLISRILGSEAHGD